MSNDIKIHKAFIFTTIFLMFLRMYLYRNRIFLER